MVWKSNGKWIRETFEWHSKDCIGKLSCIIVETKSLKCKVKVIENIETGYRILSIIFSLPYREHGIGDELCVDELSQIMKPDNIEN